MPLTVILPTSTITKMLLDIDIVMSAVFPRLFRTYVAVPYVLWYVASSRSSEGKQRQSRHTGF